MRRRRKEVDPLNSAELLRRASKLDSDDLLESMETTLNNLCRYMIDYRRERRVEYLGEIKMTAEGIFVMAGELDRRKQISQEVMGGPPPQKPIAPARQSRLR